MKLSHWASKESWSMPPLLISYGRPPGLLAMCLFILLGCAGAAAITANAVVVQTNNPTRIQIVTLRGDADQDKCVEEHKIEVRRSYRHALNGFSAELDDAA